MGERWSLLIVRDALLRGISRFSEFQRSLGIAPNILTARLEGFVVAGLMERRTRPDRAGQPEYLLTEKGRDLAPVILALTAWGDRWAAPQGPPVVYEHQGCGGGLHQQVHCEICGHVPAPADMTVRPRRADVAP